MAGIIGIESTGSRGSAGIEHSLSKYIAQKVNVYAITDHGTLPKIKR